MPLLFPLQMLNEGIHHLTNARDNYQNYDFENRLCVRIHSALRYYGSVKIPPKPKQQQQQQATATISGGEEAIATSSSSVMN